jgi:hypothetical protein
MPIWLRRLTFNYIKEHYDKEKEEYDKQNRKLNNNSTPAIARPPIPNKPTYTAKAPKK